MDHKPEQQAAHLAMIQAVIARMASNSFALKTLSVTLTAGIIALIGAIQHPNSIYAIAGALPVIIFWWMDAKYLQLERLYRILYDEVRMNHDHEPFGMRVNRYYSQVQPLRDIAVSWSIVPIYSVLIAVLVIIAYVIWRSN